MDLALISTHCRFTVSPPQVTKASSTFLSFVFAIMSHRDPSAGSSNDHLLNQRFSNHVPDTFCSVHRPFSSCLGSNPFFDSGFHTARGKGTGGTGVPEYSGFSSPAPRLDPFPPLDFGASWTQRSLQISKAISCLAHYPGRWPDGLISADWTLTRYGSTGAAR